MQAIVATGYGDSDVLSVQERSVPEPAANEVRIQTEAAGLNFADVEKRRGNYPNAPEPPFIPGMEAAGRIDAVGDGVNYDLGTRVTALGQAAFAEYVVVRADRVFEIPTTLSFTNAAAVPVQWFTAHNCLHEWGGLTAGETVLVHAAAGGVGSAAVQLAASTGATVIGTASTADKLAFAEDCGADLAVNYEDNDVVAAVESKFGNAPVDLVLDGVGGRAFKAGLDLLDDVGRVVVYGMAAGRPGTAATPRLFFENKSIVGYHLEHALTHVPDRVQTAVNPVFRSLSSGRAEVQIYEQFSLSEASNAFHCLETRASRGKIVFDL